MAKEYKYRMLVYPNITKKYNEIHKDSYMVLLPQVLRAISKINKSLHITVFNPIYLYELEELKNVEQRIYNIRFSSNNNRMRADFFFDAGVFMDVLDWQNNDYDIIYSHLPEHTFQLSNLIHNQTHSVPKVLGYCHWFETDNQSPKRMLLQNYIGLLEMEQCGVNSQWLKDKVLKDAKKTFNDKTMERLEKIIQPHTLGIDDYDLSPTTYRGKKIIAFNHRGQKYMGWDFFKKAMDKLWKKRKDFKVITFQKDANASKYKWAENQPPLDVDRETYFSTLKKSYIGVGCFMGYSGGSSWSISVTDGLSLGVPYVLPNKLVYPHMVGEDYPLFYDFKSEASFLETINNVLDDKKLHKKTIKHIEPIVKKMKWLPSVKSWMDWKEFFNPNTYPMVGEKSEAYKRIVQKIKNHKTITKRQLIGEMNWGVSFKFGRYRNRLRTDKRIKFLKDGYEWVG